MSKVQEREVNRRDFLFEREQKSLKDSAFSQTNADKRSKRVQSQNAYQDIKEQVCAFYVIITVTSLLTNSAFPFCLFLLDAISLQIASSLSHLFC